MKALATALMVTATLVGMSAAHADGKTREQVQQELQAAKPPARSRLVNWTIRLPPSSAPACRASKSSRSCKAPRLLAR